MQKIRMKRDNEMYFPAQGTNQDLFTRLSEYISEFDKDWINKIRPATKEQINALKEVSRLSILYKRELPKAYETYLSHMGADNGDLFPLCVNSSIDEIIQVHRDYIEDDIPTHGNYFPFDEFDLAGVLSIDLSAGGSENIVHTQLGEFINVESENFEKFLFQSAFRKYERYSSNEIFSSTRKKIIERISNPEVKDIFDAVQYEAGIISAKYDVQKAWFSDFNHYIAIGTDIAFMIKRTAGDAGYGFVTGENAEMVRGILDELILKLGFNRK